MSSLIYSDINKPAESVRVTDAFWKPRIEQISKVTIPYELDILEDKVGGLTYEETSRAIANLKIAAGVATGEYIGNSFLDSDIGKWIEAVAMDLRNNPNPALENKVDEIVELYEKSQWEDGYLNTFFTVVMPEKRWSSFCYPCELYSMGHLMEGAAEYYHATGKRKFLDICCKLADLMCETFGYASEGKLEACDGHVEVELGLIKLYKATKIKKYLDLALFFIDIRGSKPDFFEKEYCLGVNAKTVKDDDGNIRKWFLDDHSQAHKPVRDQDKPEGHAVKVTYLLAIMADLILLGCDSDGRLQKAAEKIWNNMTSKQMFITGAVGAQAMAERFTLEYDLPNDVCYTETCASIGLGMAGKRMFHITHDASYADIMELSLYNGMLVGLSDDAKHFFYVNPLHMDPVVAAYREDHHRVALKREKWFYVACCPPNIARYLADFDDYIYDFAENTVFMNLYVANELTAKFPAGRIKLTTSTNYPWDGEVLTHLSVEKPFDFTLAYRIPGWCENWSLKVNGEKAEGRLEKGCFYIERTWHGGDTVVFSMDMPVRLMKARKEVYEDTGKVAIQKGPIVYCMEGIDNGGSLRGLYVDCSTDFSFEYRPELLKGAGVITLNGFRDIEKWEEDELYKPYAKKYEPMKLTAVPYYMWGNRGMGDLDVWLPVL